MGSEDGILRFGLCCSLAPRKQEQDLSLLSGLGRRRHCVPEANSHHRKEEAGSSSSLRPSSAAGRLARQAWRLTAGDGQHTHCTRKFAGRQCPSSLRSGDGQAGRHGRCHRPGAVGMGISLQKRKKKIQAVLQAPPGRRATGDIPLTASRLP